MASAPLVNFAYGHKNITVIFHTYQQIYISKPFTYIIYNVFLVECVHS
jgi:hypothetical protein